MKMKNKKLKIVGSLIAISIIITMSIAISQTSDLHASVKVTQNTLSWGDDSITATWDGSYLTWTGVMNNLSINNLRQPLDYIIWYNGSKYVAMNTSSELIQYSDSTFHGLLETVAQNNTGILIKAGTYTEPINHEHVGSSDSDIGGSAILIRDKHDITIEGEGWGNTIIKLANGSQWGQLFELYNCDDIVVSNIEFDGNGLNNTYTPATNDRPHIVWAEACDNIVFNHLYVHHAIGHGIGAGFNASKIKVMNCKVYYCAIIVNSEGYHRDGDGITIDDNTFYFEISHNYIEKCNGKYTTGIEIEDGDSWGIITDNIVRDCHKGIEGHAHSGHPYMKHIIIANNIIDEIHQPTGAPADELNHVIGIGLDLVHDGVIANNILTYINSNYTDNYTGAITARGKRIIITGNVINGTSGDTGQPGVARGIFVCHEGQFFKITNNIIYNVTTGIQIGISGDTNTTFQGFGISDNIMMNTTTAIHVYAGDRFYLDDNIVNSLWNTNGTVIEEANCSNYFNSGQI